MKRLVISALLTGLPAMSFAQDATVPAPATVTAEAARGTRGILAGLDKISGQTTEMELAVGDAVRLGYLDVRLSECRYPAGDPESDAFALISVTDTKSGNLLFNGWMIESSPALSALDHPRYDVWVISCQS